MAHPGVSDRANAFVADVGFALLAESKVTTPLHQDEILGYIKVALERMRRSSFDETSRIVPAVQFLCEELDLMAMRERNVVPAPSFTSFYDKWTDRILAPTRTLLMHHRAYRDRQIYLPELTNSLLHLLSDAIPEVEAYAVSALSRRARETAM